MVEPKPKLFLLLVPVLLSMGYFISISTSDANWLSKEIAIMIPLQVLALVYVFYHNSRKRLR